MIPELRILTVRNPWAWAIIHGQKDVENRVRNVAGGYRGPIAIHVGLAEDVNAFSLSPSALELNRAAGDWERTLTEREMKSNRTSPWRVGFGAIIGVVDLTDVHHWSECLEGVFGCSPWAMSDVHHLALANPRPLVTPIPYKGALGLRRLPEDVAAAVWAEVAS